MPFSTPQESLPDSESGRFVIDGGKSKRVENNLLKSDKNHSVQLPVSTFTMDFFVDSEGNCSRDAPDLFSTHGRPMIDPDIPKYIFVVQPESDPVDDEDEEPREYSIMNKHATDSAPRLPHRRSSAAESIQLLSRHIHIQQELERLFETACTQDLMPLKPTRVKSVGLTAKASAFEGISGLGALTNSQLRPTPVRRRGSRFSSPRSLAPTKEDGPLSVLPCLAVSTRSDDDGLGSPASPLRQWLTMGQETNEAEATQHDRNHGSSLQVLMSSKPYLMMDDHVVAASHNEDNETYESRELCSDDWKECSDNNDSNDDSDSFLLPFMAQQSLFPESYLSLTAAAQRASPKTSSRNSTLSDLDTKETMVADDDESTAVNHGSEREFRGCEQPTDMEQDHARELQAPCESTEAPQTAAPAVTTDHIPHQQLQHRLQTLLVRRHSSSLLTPLTTRSSMHSSKSFLSQAASLASSKGATLKAVLAPCA